MPLAELKIPNNLINSRSKMYVKYYVTDINFLKLIMQEIALGYFKSGGLKHSH